MQDENGKGYGLVHIEANHGKQIRNAGFDSVEEFISYVAENYDEENIRVGKRRYNGSSTFLIQVTDSHDNTLFIELSRDGSYWNVNSAGIFRKGYSNKKETVAKTEPQQPNNAVSSGSSLSKEESDGITSSEPNGKPTVSESKSKKKSLNGNELEEKRVQEPTYGKDKNFDFDSIEELKDAPYTVRNGVNTYATLAYYNAVLNMPKEFFVEREEDIPRMTYDRFEAEFKKVASHIFERAQPYLPAVYEYMASRVETLSAEHINSLNKRSRNGDGTTDSTGGSENESGSGEVKENLSPSLLDVVKTLYTRGKEVASKLFSMKFFEVGTTPKFMQDLGLRGDKFTIKYGVIARHIGKDSSHTLTESDWEQLPNALQSPFAIAKLTDKEDAYRLYTTLQTQSGEFVVVGVDVKNAGREIEVNSISTVFGRRNNANLPNNEEVIYESEEITPEQSALLKRPNFAQYPTEKELSADKGSQLSLNGNELRKKIAEEESKVNTNPSDAQKEAGNYKKGHIQVGSLDVTIENPIVDDENKRYNTDIENVQAIIPRKLHNQMAERVKELAAALHLDHVEVVTSVDGLKEKQKKAKGFYTKSTGKITIVVPNNMSLADVEQTLLHEAVAHYGLRKLFGSHFDTFLDNVFNNADEDIRRKIVDFSLMNGWDLRKATEEYLASLAENTNFENINSGWWRKIKKLFIEMLHKIGFEGFNGVTFSDNELRYILWRSYENLVNPGRYRSALNDATDIFKQYKLGVGNYNVSEHPSSSVAEDDDILERSVQNKTTKSYLRDQFSRENIQDRMISVKRMIEDIERLSGKPVENFENPYLIENHLL